MKKLIVFILIISINLVSIAMGSNEVFAQNSIPNPINSEQAIKENKYINQLESISKQLEILSSNILEKITNNKDKKDLSKDAAYIKTQIRSLRSVLSEYHKTESGDIERNPISLALLNALNYYSMSLSYLQGVIEYDDSSDESKYLEQYFSSKSSGDAMLYWVKEHINK